MDLNGNNNSVTLAAKDLNVTGQKATGVNVSGDANTINITGNVPVSYTHLDVYKRQSVF